MNKNAPYKTIRIKVATHKNIKRLALEMDITVIQLIELMFEKFVEKNNEIM